MTDEWTCGKGLAAHSRLPRAMGEMLSAMPYMLDTHTRALDLTDAHGRMEYAAYAGLVAQQTTIAASLNAPGDDMAGYDDLPMAPHDMAVLTSPATGAAFQAMVDAEKMLLDVLKATVDEHEQMPAS